jgi:hypothetical protein
MTLMVIKTLERVSKNYYYIIRGKDKEGHRIRVDEKYHPTTVSYIEQNGDRVRVVASSKEEAKEMIQKNFPE